MQYIQDDLPLNYGIDFKRWEDAITAYIGYTHKTAEEATFRQAKNLLWFVAREMPQSRFVKGIVRPLSEYVGSKKVAGMIVACALRKKGLSIKTKLHTHKGVTGRALMTQGSRGRLKFAGWASEHQRARYYTKDMAIQENRKRSRMTNAHLGFSMLIPVKALDRLKEIAKNFGVNLGGFKLKGNKPTKKNQGEPPLIKITKSQSRVSISIHSAYNFKKTTNALGYGRNTNAEFYDAAIAKALPTAIANTIDDMRQYIIAKERKKNPTFGMSWDEMKYYNIGRSLKV